MAAILIISLFLLILGPVGGSALPGLCEEAQAGPFLCTEQYNNAKFVALKRPTSGV